MWNVAGEPCVCLYSGAVTVGVCHTTMFSVVYIMTQAERLRQKELQRRRNNNKKKTIQLLDNVLLSHLSKIKNCRHRLERVKLWTIFGDLKYLLGLASIVSRKKKSIYVYLL